MAKPLTEIVPVSRELCAYLSSRRFGDLPQAVIQAARRGVLDWLGCALAGSRHSSLNQLLPVLKHLSGRPEATVFGRNLKLAPVDAALANGYMGHVLDYDDTHLGGTILHASSPVLAALFALSDCRRVSGEDFVLAYVCGFEAGVRSGQASPGHHRGGWHLTGTLGCLAAGIAAGKLLRLDARGLNHALGIAATQAAGMQQNRGTLCKYLHAGKAAASGVLAGLLAQQGFDSAQDIMEGERGFCRIYSDVAEPEALIDDLGTRWEITRNGYKPYACAAVLHPVIDSMIMIRSDLQKAGRQVDPENVNVIELTVSPYVMLISGVRAPESGMQAKFSVFHTAVVSLLDGDGGVAQYSDERVLDPLLIALRCKVKINVDESLPKDESSATVVIAGEAYRCRVEHATGTIDNPMEDVAIEAKFLANSEPVIGSARAGQVLQIVRGVDKVADVRELTGLCA